MSCYEKYDEVNPQNRDDFENYLVNGIHASRYVASWLKAGGIPYFHCRLSTFRKWLESLIINGRHLTDDEIYHICKFGENGKLELEVNAKLFIKDNMSEEDKVDLKRILDSDEIKNLTRKTRKREA